MDHCIQFLKHSNIQSNWNEEAKSAGIFQLPVSTISELEHLNFTLQRLRMLLFIPWAESLIEANCSRRCKPVPRLNEDLREATRGAGWWMVWSGQQQDQAAALPPDCGWWLVWVSQQQDVAQQQAAHVPVSFRITNPKSK